MSEGLVTREEAQQAFETLCKYFLQHKKPDTVLCLFMLEEYDLDEYRPLITLHDAGRAFEMCYYVGGGYGEDSENNENTKDTET